MLYTHRLRLFGVYLDIRVVVVSLSASCDRSDIGHARGRSLVKSDYLYLLTGVHTSKSGLESDEQVHLPHGEVFALNRLVDDGSSGSNLVVCN